MSRLFNLQVVHQLAPNATLILYVLGALLAIVGLALAFKPESRFERLKASAELKAANAQMVRSLAVFLTRPTYIFDDDVADDDKAELRSADTNARVVALQAVREYAEQELRVVAATNGKGVKRSISSRQERRCLSA